MRKFVQSIVFILERLLISMTTLEDQIVAIDGKLDLVTANLVALTAAVAALAVPAPTTVDLTEVLADLEDIKTQVTPVVITPPAPVVTPDPVVDTPPVTDTTTV